MTFEEFQATRRISEDMRETIGDDYTPTPVAGMLYLDQCHIFAQADGSWLLVIGNWERVSDDLKSLEVELYDWAKAEYDL